MGLRDADGRYGAGDEQADLMSARGRSQGSNRLADLVTIFLAPVGSAGLASATIFLGLLGFLLVEGGHFQPSTWTSEDQYFVGALSRSGGGKCFLGRGLASAHIDREALACREPRSVDISSPDRDGGSDWGLVQPDGAFGTRQGRRPNSTQHHSRIRRLGFGIIFDAAVMMDLNHPFLPEER
jgi:hypothetical protein